MVAVPTISTMQVSENSYKYVDYGKMNVVSSHAVDLKGSCIDGRLTSAWNWCSQLPQKPFYPIFKLTGFIGFDGEFK